MSAFEPLQQPAEVAVQAIGFLLADNFSLLTLAAMLEPLRRANQFSGRLLYRWQTLTMGGQPVRDSNGMQVAPDGPAVAEAELDALILCGAAGAQHDGDPAQNFLLQRLAGRGVHLGGVAGGSWTLAKAGLLSGYQCCAGWEQRVDLRDSFPDIELRDDQFVLDRDRYTAASGGAALEMMLALIERAHGPVLAAAIGETLALEQMRGEAAPARLPMPRSLGSVQPKLQEAMALMEANLDEPIELEQLADLVGLSRRQLERLFAQYLRCSPSRYYLKLRLLQARQLLRQTARSILEIANGCGFVSAQHFSKCYREHFGTAPSRERQGNLQRWRLALH